VAFVLVQPPALMNLQLTADGQSLERRTPLLFIGVNPQQMATFGIEGHHCLEEGRLAMCVTRPLKGTALWRLALRGLVRGLHGAPELEVLCSRELAVSVRRKRVRVALDGEIVRLHSPLRYRLLGNALHVLAPSDYGVPRVPGLT
jgi:diacylglycerol kinase family enzyme